MKENISLLDASPQANALRAILDGGATAYIEDLGNGIAVHRRPENAGTGNLFQVNGPEVREAGVVATWPTVPMDTKPGGGGGDTNELVIIHRPGLVHAPSREPADVPARKTLTAPASPIMLKRIHMRFKLKVGRHPPTPVSTANWNLAWLQGGETWRHNVFCYANYFAHRGFVRLTTNYKHPTGGAIHRDVRGVSLDEGRTYVVDFEYVAGSHAQVVITDSETGYEVARVREERRIADVIVVPERWRLALGHERGEKDARLEVGWGYQWHDVELNATPATTPASIQELANDAD